MKPDPLEAIRALGRKRMSEKTGKDRALGRPEEANVVLTDKDDAECPECGGNIGCLNGCTGDMTVQLRAALRSAKIGVLREALDLICLETSALDAIHAMIAKLEGER